MHGGAIILTTIGISARYDALIDLRKLRKTEIFEFALSSRYRLDYVYLAGAAKGVSWIWTVDPPKNGILLVLQLTR